MQQSILLIDEDTKLSSELSAYLSQHQFEVHCSHNGEEGLKLALNKPFDAVIMDILLPEYNGLQILQSIREHHHVPVLFLSSRNDSIDTLLAFTLGADDYLHKPCDANELLLRLNCILQRSKQQAKPPFAPLTYQHICMDCTKRIVTLHDECIELTNTEFNILEILMKSPGQAFSKEELTEYALGRKFTAYDRSIDVHISNLRNKLGHNQRGETWINTVRGFGYQFNA